MWIRSQSRGTLGYFKAIYTGQFGGKNVVFAEVAGVMDSESILGVYETEERAKEVLDMIQDRLMQGTKYDSIYNGKRTTRDFVFQMPEE